MNYEQAYEPPSSRWHVYAIAPDNRLDEPFYIGMTKNIQARARAHNSPDSAAYRRSLALETVGIHCELFSVCEFPTRAEALAYEAALISVLPGLTNKAVPSSLLNAYRERRKANVEAHQ